MCPSKIERNITMSAARGFIHSSRQRNVTTTVKTPDTEKLKIPHKFETRSKISPNIMQKLDSLSMF